MSSFLLKDQLSRAHLLTTNLVVSKSRTLQQNQPQLAEHVGSTSFRWPPGTAIDAKGINDKCCGPCVVSVYRTAFIYELKDKAKACTTNEELLALAESEGIELTDEQLNAMSGGITWSCSDRACDDNICSDFSVLD